MTVKHAGCIAHHKLEVAQFHNTPIVMLFSCLSTAGCAGDQACTTGVACVLVMSHDVAKQHFSCWKWHECPALDSLPDLIRKAFKIKSCMPYPAAGRQLDTVSR